MLLSSFLVSACLAMAEAPDTLDFAVAYADRKITVSRIDTVSFADRITSGSAADLLQSVTGIQLNDNGGASGLKTVSIRGMGSTHTQVSIDGVKVGNIQNGQIDFGTIGLVSADGMSVDYVNSSVNLMTKRPSFAEGGKFGGKVSMSAGDFATYSPALKLNALLSPRVSASVNASYLTQGDFLSGAYGEDSYYRRANSDLQRLQCGFDLFGDLRDFSGDWHVKAFANDSDRGCPGSLDWPSEDRQNDFNAFLQGSLRRNVSDVYNYRVSAKAAIDKMEYIGSGYTSLYDQKEFMLASENTFRVSGPLAFKADADLTYDRLDADLYDASRLGVDVKTAALINAESVKAEASLRYLGAFDKGGVRRNCLMPLVSARFILSENMELFASGRRSYRVPTFNDLYYIDEWYLPNYDLKPEDAWMTEAGVRLSRAVGAWSAGLCADLYYNHLKDKIVYVSDPETWKGTMENLDQAETYGVDADAKLAYASGAFNAGLDLRYTLQEGTVIPYQPKHKASATLDCGWKGWNAMLSLNLHGDAADSYGTVLPSWTTLGASLSKEWKRLTVKGSVSNITDKYYETVIGYPMPGQMAMIGIDFKF